MKQRDAKKAQNATTASTAPVEVTPVGEDPLPTSGDPLPTSDDPLPVGGVPVPVGGGPPKVFAVGRPGGLHAQAYAGFFCGPDTNEGVNEILKVCNDLPTCKFKRVDDGAVKALTTELEEGQGDCMRRCDARFNMSEEHCAPGEKCHSFVMGCKCANLNDEGCRPYKD
jgi:hypothetical protein